MECSGLNINAADDNGRTALFYAAQFERIILLQRLLSSYGALVDVKDKSGRTALSYAVQRNSYRSTELLLEAGAEIALEDDQGRSPLFYAVEAGNCAATVRLVRHMKDGNPALLLAGQMGRTKIESKLMTLEASITNWDNGILQKLLLRSAHSGRDDMVRPLVQAHGVEVDTQDADGRTPLSLAAERGHCNIVRILSKSGANRELKDSNRQSPVDYALRDGPVTYRCILGNWMPWPRDPIAAC
jgi:ankyrin repeat protein